MGSPFASSIIKRKYAHLQAAASSMRPSISGTSMEPSSKNAWLPPDTGNICFGVWKQIAARTVRLHHIGWMFTPGSTPPTASGTFTLDETNTLSRDGKSYTGTFTFKTFDSTGAPHRRGSNRHDRCDPNYCRLRMT
jgi:hypothetical protein